MTARLWGAGNIKIAWCEQPQKLHNKIVTCCDASPIFQPAEHDLDTISAHVTALVVLDGYVALLPTRDAGAYPFVFQRFSEPVSVIATITKQPVAVW